MLTYPPSMGVYLNDEHPRECICIVSCENPPQEYREIAGNIPHKPIGYLATASTRMIKAGIKFLSTDHQSNTNKTTSHIPVAPNARIGVHAPP